VIAVNEYDQVFGWGLNDKMQLGLNADEKMIKTPQLLQTFTESETIQVHCLIVS
jgi:alpha-tubulin suppressor-like RCC1 family protein